MAKKSVKQIISDAKNNLKNVSNKTKVKISAGLMAGSMLFTLVGCAPTRVNNSKDELETKGSETVEKAEVESNPVLDQTLEAQLASITNRLEEILRAQGVSAQAIAELRKKVDGCVTPSQMQGAINSMKDQIESHVSKEIDEKLSSMEGSIKQPEQKPESGEIKFGGEIDLDEMLSILQQMSFDIRVGNRTDYHKMFIEAERFDAILKSTDNGLDKAKLDRVQQEISTVQQSAWYLIIEGAIAVEQSQTGCMRLDIHTLYQDDEEAISGCCAVDEKGKYATISSDVSFAEVIKDDKLISCANGDYSEYELSPKDKKQMCGSKWLASALSGSIGPDCDYSYNPIDGYTKVVRFDHETVSQSRKYSTYTTQVKLDEKGGIEFVQDTATSYTEERDEQGSLSSTYPHTSVSYYEVTPIEQAEMDNLEKQAVSMIESARQETDTSEQ